MDALEASPVIRAAPEQLPLASNWTSQTEDYSKAGRALNDP
jgi:hypothetical protein